MKKSKTPAELNPENYVLTIRGLRPKKYKKKAPPPPAQDLTVSQLYARSLTGRLKKSDLARLRIGAAFEVDPAE